MLVDSYIIPQCEIRPGSFGGLMALYESNFIKLTHLAGEPAQLDRIYWSRPPGDCELRLTIDGRTKYTRLLHLTYVFEETDGVRVEPDMSLRVYLDARMVEVMGWAECQRHVILRKLARQIDRELDRRWTCNMVLSKWLDYLLDMGHSLKPVADTDCSSLAHAGAEHA